MGEEEEVEDMEFHILSAISWHVNPPTTLSFVRNCLDLIDNNNVDKSVRDKMYALSKVQSELSVTDPQYLTYKPSMIAYCSLMNCLKIIGMDEESTESIRMTLILSLLWPFHDISEQAVLIAQVQESLYKACLRKPETTHIFLQETSPQNKNTGAIVYHSRRSL